MPSFTDQLNRSIRLPALPKRMVSLVPSQTELLADLGLEQEVAGITKFCIHPTDWFRNKTRVGGTKQLHLDKIRALQPDLIIANKEENEKAQLEILMREFPVWISDVDTLPAALDMIRSVGALTGKEKKAVELATEICRRFQTLNPRLPAKTKTAYFIWRDPWMVAGSQTFIHDMLQRCGLKNCFEHLPRYPEITLQQLHETNCELILLSSEPYPFGEKHLADFRKRFPKTDIRLVNGEMFSWYGSRLLQTPEYFLKNFM